MSAEVTPTISVFLKEKSDIERYYLEEFKQGGVFVSRVVDHPVGQIVCVDIVCAKDKVSMQIPGVVRWKRTRGTPGLPAGTGIEVSVPNTAHSLLRVFSDRLGARPRRFHVTLSAIATIDGQKKSGTVRNVSRSGAFLECSMQPPLGSEIELEVTLAGGSIKVNAHVRRHQVGQGLGLEIAPASATSWQGLFLQVLARATKS